MHREFFFSGGNPHQFRSSQIKRTGPVLQKREEKQHDKPLCAGWVLFYLYKVSDDPVI